MTNPPRPADVPVPHVAVVITSFGYRHAPAPTAEITLDVRRILRDPHVDPKLRELTGLDDAVRDTVARTPGARRLVTTTAGQIAQLLVDAGDPAGLRVDLAVGCASGRHRSVALAEMTAQHLRDRGIGVEVDHRDLHRPVLPPAQPGAPA